MEDERKDGAFKVTVEMEYTPIGEEEHKQGGKTLYHSLNTLTEIFEKNGFGPLDVDINGLHEDTKIDGKTLGEAANQDNDE